MNAVAMMKPAILKEFRIDYETARAGLPTARLSLQAERDEKRAKDTIRRTRLARLEVGQALYRMHSTKSYENEHDSWASLCRALKLPREESYELMNSAGVHGQLPVSDVAAIPEGLTSRNLQFLGKQEPEERDAILHESVKTGNANAALTRLRTSLDAAPDVPLNEGEAPTAPRADHDLAWIRRQVTSLTRWYEERHMIHTARIHLNALLAIAEEKSVDLGSLAEQLRNEVGNLEPVAFTREGGIKKK